MQLYDLKEQLKEINNKFNVIKEKNLGLKLELKKLEEKEQDPSVWQDIELSSNLGKQIKILRAKLSKIKEVENLILDLKTGIELFEESAEYIKEPELENIYFTLNAKFQVLWIDSNFDGEYDAGSAVIMLHSGAGGEEAQDWAEMLARMYTRYAESRGYKVSLIDTVPGDGAGIKSQTYLIEGDYAYGYLKSEKGVHRLVRLSPFDANNRRHTSFASLEVSPFIENVSDDIKINAEDIIVDTFRSSGAGGQHVNKTESAIRITHKPTGIVVTCQNERSQVRNKEMAMKLLASKLMELELNKKEQEKMEKLAKNKKIEWGSQIRSYVLHPYSLAKDHRTGYETGNVSAVLDGELAPFINEYLKVTSKDEN